MTELKIRRQSRKVEDFLLRTQEKHQFDRRLSASSLTTVICKMDSEVLFQ